MLSPNNSMLSNELKSILKTPTESRTDRRRKRRTSPGSRKSVSFHSRVFQRSITVRSLSDSNRREKRKERGPETTESRSNRDRDEGGESTKRRRRSFSDSPQKTVKRSSRRERRGAEKRRRHFSDSDSSSELNKRRKVTPNKSKKNTPKRATKPAGYTESGSSVIVDGANRMRYRRNGRFVPLAKCVEDGNRSELEVCSTPESKSSRRRSRRREEEEEDLDIFE